MVDYNRPNEYDDIGDGKPECVLTLDIENQFKVNVPSRIDSDTATVLGQTHFRNLNIPPMLPDSVMLIAEPN